jgi:hemolysin activation/secretion protein
MIKIRSKANSYLLLFCVVSWPAQAQVAPNAGSILREQTQPRLELPRPPAANPRLEEPSRPAMQPDTVHFVLESVRITGNTVFSNTELKALAQAEVGKEIGYPELYDITVRISRYYREHGYLVARAYLPAQSIKDGNVEVAILEGRFGNTKIDNRTHVRDSVLHSHVDGLAGTAVTELSLERKVLLLSDLSGVNGAHVVLSPGANIGESDVDFDLGPMPWITGVIEYDNQGNKFTGANQLSGQINLLSPLGLGDQMTGRFTKGLDGLMYGRLNYLLPLGSDGLKLGASYSASQYKLGGTFAPLHASGDSGSYSLSTSYPFILRRDFSLLGQASYNWSGFEDRIASTLSFTKDKTRSANIGLSGNLSDNLLGSGVSVFSLVYSAGEVDIQTPATLAIDKVSARTNGSFDKVNFTFIHENDLTENTSMFFSYSGQKAGNNLDSSEKFILGGANGVRAYPLGEGTGDSGYVATFELRHNTKIDILPGTLQSFVFVDAGAITVSENPFATGVNHRHMSGAGLGLAWVGDNLFQVKLTVANRIGNGASTSVETDQSTMAWIQVSKYF